MKWLVGSLIAINIFIFLLASLSDDRNQNNQHHLQVAENLSAINLVNSTTSPLPGNCSNIGPIKQQIVLDQLKKVLSDKSLSYRVVAEAAREVASYRVLIPIDNSSEVAELKQRLIVTGVEEPYEKTLANGDVILSLGVFTYKKTAAELAGNLVNAGFAARAGREFLLFPQRYWVNLDQSLDQLNSAGLSSYADENKLHQTSAKCL